MLNDNERKKYEIIDKVINGEMTRKEAMDELNLSRQQIYRLICLYHSKGKDGFAHGNRGKVNPNKKDANLIEELENRDSVMKKESQIEIETTKKEHHKYISPKNHPWRKNMMLNH